LNLIVVMLLGGLWHGASWTFVAWGAFHGALLAYERYRGKRSLYERLPHVVRVGATFVLVLFSWVLFRSTSFHDAASYLGSMLGLGASTTDPSVLLLASQLYTREAILIMTVCALLVSWPTQAFEWSATVSWPKALVIHPLFVVALLAMFAQAFNPFLYFQF
jgi:alginate O-acetyltransferase complex protein AlgI